MNPLDTNDYRQRIDKAQKALADRDTGALLLGPSAGLTYLTGFNAHHSERMNLLIVTPEGTPRMVAPALEAPLIGGAGELLEVHTWEDQDNPAALAASLVGYVAGKTIAVENTLWSAFLLRLQNEIPGATWVEGD